MGAKYTRCRLSSLSALLARQAFGALELVQELLGELEALATFVGLDRDPQLQSAFER
jgi:hypothetical protein